MVDELEADEHEEEIAADRAEVNDLRDFGRDLTDWEIDFFDSLSDRLDAGRRLTERQKNILSRIRYEKG